MARARLDTRVYSGILRLTSAVNVRIYPEQIFTFDLTPQKRRTLR